VQWVSRRWPTSATSPTQRRSSTTPRLKRSSSWRRLVRALLLFIQALVLTELQVDDFKITSDLVDKESFQSATEMDDTTFKRTGQLFLKRMLEFTGPGSRPSSSAPPTPPVPATKAPPAPKPAVRCVL
jgi:hypothetical protein